MRKFSLLLSTIVVLALALTACGGQQTSTSIPSTNVPPVTVESTATEAPTSAATEAPSGTGTASVPVTGAENPSRVSNLMKFQVFDQSGNQVGKVKDLVLDLDNTRVSYVAVDATGSAGSKTVLIPWDSLQIQSQAGA